MNDENRDKELEVTERTAVDVLLSIESKLDTLIKSVSVNDLTNKIILNGLNKLVNVATKSEVKEENKNIKIYQEKTIPVASTPFENRKSTQETTEPAQQLATHPINKVTEKIIIREK
jgi:acetolactate synthase small subunit